MHGFVVDKMYIFSNFVAVHKSISKISEKFTNKNADSNKLK